MAAERKQRRAIGNLIAPPRFLLFLAVTGLCFWLLTPAWGLRIGSMLAFDAGALLFLIACLPLLRHKSTHMRRSACRNGANRLLLLALTGAVMLAILAAVASELMQRHAPDTPTLALIVATLALSWTFSNTIYALHYAHLFYLAAPEGEADAGGLQFPETPEPDYWDFVYFAFCLGMTFQTSDVTITQGRMRRPVTAHCLAAFVFNLGIIAFTINVLGGG